MQAVKQEFPKTCLQWEDFANSHARPILQCYRDKLLTFNDDIQGTAAVALGAILSAIKVTGKTFGEQQIVMFGAGSAAIGVADGLRAAMKEEGVTEQEARSRFWLLNSKGLLHSGRKDLSPEQNVYAQPESRISGWPRTSNGRISLADVIGKIDATILIGLSTVAGIFSEAIIREMARKVERPVIFPLSNPTANSEATAEDLIRWTDGRALVATGSPFAPVDYGGAQHSDRAMQQCLHLSRHRTRCRCLGGTPSHGSDDACSSSSPRDKFACTKRSLCGLATSINRIAKSGRRNRAGGCNPGTEGWCGCQVR